MRARRGFIADLVDSLAQEVGKPHILSVASGHLREALLCSTIKRRRFSRYVALDSDEHSLAEVSRSYGVFGVQTFDASAGGLGGCPYAPGAAGNLATDDLIYMLDGLGIETGVSLAAVSEASAFIASKIDHRLPSRYFRATHLTET